MASSSDISPPTDDPGMTTERANNSRPRPSRLNQALAWVGIAAGGLFIVAAIFFSGVFLSWIVGGHDEHIGPQPMACCDKMKPGEMMPGGMMGPAPQSPATTAPGSPRP